MATKEQVETWLMENIDLRESLQDLSRQLQAEECGLNDLIRLSKVPFSGNRLPHFGLWGICLRVVWLSLILVLFCFMRVVGLRRGY